MIDSLTDRSMEMTFTVEEADLKNCRKSYVTSRSKSARGLKSMISMVRVQNIIVMD